MPLKKLPTPIKLTATFLSCFTLSFLAGSLTFIPKPTHAEESTQLASDIDVTISPVISLTAPTSANLSITPLSTGANDTTNISINVSTNNSTGYNLTMSTNSTESALTHATTTNKIPSTTNITPAPLTLNTWGYNLGTNQTNFRNIPANNQTPATINTTTTPAITSTNPITLGARADTTIPSGIYSNTLVFTATTNYVPEPDLTTISTLQQATRARCEATEGGTTVELIDTRDNKVYRVRKMIDGNCWFIDNLAFVPPTSSSAPGYIPFSPAASLISSGSMGDTQARYASNPSYTTAAGQTTYLYNWCAALGDTSANCLASVAANTNNTVINGTLNTTGTTTSQPEVTGICPAPFRLPKGGPVAASTTTPNTANEFVNLDLALGGTGLTQSSAPSYTNWMNTDNDSSSWSGVHSGYFSSSLGAQGSIGYWWSSTALSSASAYHLRLFSSSSGVYPADVDVRNSGFAVRCVL